MKLVLSIYEHGVMMHVKFERMSSVLEMLLPFDCLKLNLSIQSHNLGAFLKHILNIYDHGVVMYLVMSYNFIFNRI